MSLTSLPSLTMLSTSRSALEASPGASRAGEFRGTSGAVVAAAFALGFAAGAVTKRGK